jgi:hypothetical protein
VKSRLTLLPIPFIVGILTLSGLLVFLSSNGSALAAQVEAPAAPAALGDAIENALIFIASKQNPDGGIDAFGLGASNESGTARAVLAVAAAGKAVDLVKTVTGTTMMDYLSTVAVTYTHDASGTTSAHLFPSNAGLFLAAVVAANQAPTAFGGMDLITELEATYHPDTGVYSTTAALGWSSGAASDINQTWSLFGLSAANREVPQKAVEYLVDSQGVDGSWGFSDLDTTAVAVVALIASGQVGPADEVIQQAIAFFKAQQLDNGGWRPSWDTDPLNADSTGWIIQALAVCGYSPVTENWAAPGGNPRTALMSLVQPDGSIGGTYVNAYSTIEALYGLTEHPLFFLGREIRVNRALSWTSDGQLPDGSWAGFPDNTGSTVDVALACAAAGFDPNSLTPEGSTNSALDYLKTEAPTYTAKGPDFAGKLAVVAVAAGQDPNDFGGVDIPDVLVSTYYSETLGGFGIVTNTYHQAWALLGLAAAENPIPVKATETLSGLQQVDGGWKYDLSSNIWNTTAADHTGLALQALIAAGLPVSDTVVQDGLAFLKAQQDALGGWGNANSTAYAIQGLVAAGEDLADWDVNGATPFEGLAAYQKVDGPFVWNWTWAADNGMATWQAVPALMGVHCPYHPAALVNFTPTLRGPDLDRMMVSMPQASWNYDIDLLIPFGGDLDGDGAVAVSYRVTGEMDWITGTAVLRGNGFFTATLPVTRLVDHDVQFLYSDSAGIQYGDQLTDTLVIEITVPPHRIFLPYISCEIR